jgi:hypothetical protein
MWNTSLVWLIGLAGLGVTWYFNTSYTQTQHSESIGELRKAFNVRSEKDDSERQKIREQFLQDSKATSTGIAELNKQTAVMTTVLQNMNRSLEKFEQKLDSFGSPSGSTRK